MMKNMYLLACTLVEVQQLSGLVTLLHVMIYVACLLRCSLPTPTSYPAHDPIPQEGQEPLP